ncbi:MAG: histidine kinase [Bacteroidota bacterium]
MLNQGKNRFSSFLQKRINKNVSYNVKSISTDSTGNFWLLTEQGLTIIDSMGNILPKTEELFKKNKVLHDKKFYYLFKDSHNTKWICTNSGLFALFTDKSKFQVAELSGAIKQKKLVFTHVLELQSGKLIATTYGNGVFEVIISSGKIVLHPIPTKGENRKLYTTLFEDKSGNVFLARDNLEIQIYATQNGQFKYLQSIPFSPNITSFQEDPKSNKIWIGSSGGLYWLEGKNNLWELYEDSIFSSHYQVTLNGLLFDKTGKLWISTNRGLISYQSSNSCLSKINNSPINQFQSFDVTDGLQESEFNFWSYLETPDNRFAFGGTNGITIFSPEHIKPYEIHAKPTITEIEINGRNIQEVKGVHYIPLFKGDKDLLLLEPENRSFGFDFSAMDYGNPKACQFMYFLKGKHGKIIDSGNKDYVKYFDLSPGEYQFELYATNAEHVWNETPYKLNLKLKYFFYETSWFFTLVGIAIIASIYAIYRNRLEHIRKKHLLTELENTILRVQMNPHFIFNSLNSIRSYIMDQDVDKADDYLVDLSLLMRKILEIADKPSITIEQEVDLLKEYMNLEAIRFSKAFEYSFEIDKNLDTSKIHIPTMILQPFVENSIIHGFSRKKNDGRILIQFTQKGDYLLCSVKDNGVGRKATQNSTKGHTSKALEITQRRLNLIKNRTGKETLLEIVDLYDLNEDPRGTQVNITFPQILP